MSGSQKTISVLVDRDLLARLEDAREAETKRRAEGMQKPSLSDVIRLVLYAGLGVVEQDVDSKPGARV